MTVFFMILKARENMLPQSASPVRRTHRALVRGPYLNCGQHKIKNKKFYLLTGNPRTGGTITFTPMSAGGAPRNYLPMISAPIYTVIASYCGAGWEDLHILSSFKYHKKHCHCHQVDFIILPARENMLPHTNGKYTWEGGTSQLNIFRYLKRQLIYFTLFIYQTLSEFRRK